MKNLYIELKNKHEKEMNAFPIGACFAKMGLDRKRYR